MKVDLERGSSEKTPIHDKITGSLSLDHMDEKHDKLTNANGALLGTKLLHIL